MTKAKATKKPKSCNTEAERKRFYRITLQDEEWIHLSQLCVARYDEGVTEAEQEGYTCFLMPEGFELDSVAESLLEDIECDEGMYHARDNKR